MKEEELDRTVCRTRFGRGYGPVVTLRNGFNSEFVSLGGGGVLLAANPCFVYGCKDRSFDPRFSHPSPPPPPPPPPPQTSYSLPKMWKWNFVIGSADTCYM
jgi:hypothetical protein